MKISIFSEADLFVQISPMFIFIQKLIAAVYSIQGPLAMLTDQQMCSSNRKLRLRAIELLIKHQCLFKEAVNDKSLNNREFKQYFEVQFSPGFLNCLF